MSSRDAAQVTGGETEPLLGGPVPTTGTSVTAPTSNGTFGQLPGESGDDVSGADASASEASDEVVHEGLPDVAAKLPVLIPAIGIGIFLCALDQLLAVATYARIGSDLNALNSTSWIATAYFLTLTSFQPLYGKLSDIFGRKECLLFSYLVFGLGCLGCGLARDMPQLVAARALAGVGGGGMNSVVSILMTDIVPLRDRGVWQGYINIIFAAGTATGAPLGGLLADSVGWRWSFIGQAPLCLVAFAAVYRVLHLPPPASRAHWLTKLSRVDLLGAAALVAAVAALLVGLDNGSNRGWRHASAAAPLATSPLLFALFVGVEMRVASHPFAPGHVIFDRSLFACFMTNFFGLAGQMPILFFLPLLYQAVGGLSAVRSGLLLIPGSVAGVSASVAGGLVIRRTGRYYRATVLAYLVLLLSTVPLALSAASAPLPLSLSAAGLVLASAGGGSGITTTLVALIAGAARPDAAVAVACSYLFRSLGSALGIGVQSAVLQQVLRAQLAAAAPELGDDGGDDIAERVRRSIDYIAELEPAVASVVRRCYQRAVTAVFASSAVFLALALVAACFIKEKRVGK